MIPWFCENALDVLSNQKMAVFATALPSLTEEDPVPCNSKLQVALPSLPAWGIVDDYRKDDSS
jgi:hypothetical protein